MKKALDAAKYIGKNFWKILPVGSKINHTNQTSKNIEKIGTFGYEAESVFHDVYALAGIASLIGYTLLGAATGAWTPKQIKQYNIKSKAETEMRAMHENSVNERYESIFQKENAKTFQDSVDIYQKYGLPIKLLEPSISQKEQAIKKNEMEAGK